MAAVQQGGRAKRKRRTIYESNTGLLHDQRPESDGSARPVFSVQPPPSTVAVVSCERLATGPGVHQYINRTYIPQRRVSENEAATRPGWKTTVQVVTASHTPAGTWQLYTYQAGSDSKRHGHSAVWTQVSRTTSRIRH